ncbi:unnamed protein product (macronuclear) [Paramecium tetraurelia]|uniref:C2H2-type domain-containing protein n=1 Tax=Paramecium tetraurelia TaxID=5888 RepID=A0DXV6_PARTE|nr:uncharacterized protein GSPATT00021497001 [Paramecium tetraurelia]CAK87873.1 unnamed protein product [Paramecium tetraurelia]|eukprot:XP_001455270.1 hypothetical protein (macronuclear) [Paramecium tetraurelia strain d4-2]
MEQQNQVEQNYENSYVNDHKQAYLEFSERLIFRFEQLLNKIEFNRDNMILFEQGQVQNLLDQQPIQIRQRKRITKRNNIILMIGNRKRYVCGLCKLIFETHYKLGGHQKGCRTHKY